MYLKIKQLFSAADEVLATPKHDVKRLLFLVLRYIHNKWMQPEGSHHDSFSIKKCCVGNVYNNFIYVHYFVSISDLLL